MAGRPKTPTEPLEESALALLSDAEQNARQVGDEDKRQSARAVLYEIGQEFNRLLKKNARAQAYQYLQRALMQNMDRLVPDIIPLKDHISTVTDLEEYLKGSLGTTSKSPLEGLADWLHGKAIQ